jgi:electron transport complex protein RnfB
MTEDVYSRLQKHLDTFLLRAPESEAILEILRIRFTPEEAEVALLLGQGPEDVPTLAGSAGMDEDALRSVLEQMADKALVFKQTRNRDNLAEAVYQLLPTAVGLWETSFAKGEKNPRTQRLARYWREYYKSAWGKALFPSKVPFTRVIPVGQSIQEQQEVYPHEQAAELIKQQEHACVLHCACRMAAELDGKGCGRPTEVCMHFGDLAKFFVEKGYARKVNLEEALEILDTSAKAGLIHMVSNSKQMGVALCSCCSCCCTQMRAIAEMNIAEPIARSRFVAQVDDEACTACEACEERCLVEAIKVVDETAEVEAMRCIGCGLCVTDCPEDAVSLGERGGYQEPADTLPELIQAFMKDAV